MKRLSHHDYVACSHAVREIYDETSRDRLPWRLLGMLARLVPADHVGFNEFDDQKGRFVVHSQPARPDIQLLMPQCEALPADHPLYDHYKTGEPTPRKISDVMSFAQFSQTGLYRDYFLRIRAKHQIDRKS